MPWCRAGFDRKRTFIFSDFQYMGGEFYKNCVRIAKACAGRMRGHTPWGLTAALGCSA